MAVSYTMQNETRLLLKLPAPLKSELAQLSRELKQPVAQTMKDAFVFSIVTGRLPEPRNHVNDVGVLVWTPAWMAEELAMLLPKRSATGLERPGNMSETMRRSLETVRRYRAEAAPEVAEAIRLHDLIGAQAARDSLVHVRACSPSAADQFVARIRSYRPRVKVT